uniref:DNA-directed RNA polymerase subunit n=1 Tax=Acrobeloides nanus TaxID=290746 RepID=A0A914C6P6_9BILA
MLLFCSVCGTSLSVEEGSASLEFKCQGCGYTLPISKPVTSRVYPRLKDLDEVLGGPSAWENAQVTEERCPRCSHNKAYFMQLQTRSADEPMTIFYRCQNSKCAHRWKE